MNLRLAEILETLTDFLCYRYSVTLPKKYNLQKTINKLKKIDAGGDQTIKRSNRGSGIKMFVDTSEPKRGT